MNKSLALQKKIYLFFSLLISFFIFLYLVYFLINADSGIMSYYKIKNQQFEYQKILSKLEDKNALLVDRIKRLKTNTIDLDYLDEQVRNNTGFIDNNELLITFDH